MPASSSRSSARSSSVRPATSISGFGSFSVSRRPPRLGRNPRSGEQVTIPEKLVPHFKPGKALREAVDVKAPAAAAPAAQEPAG